jgi:mannose-6-phosphate isomerase-like protein (cupin superfamily)
MGKERRISRRKLLAAGGVLSCTAIDGFLRSHALALEPPASGASPGGFQIDSAAVGSRARRMHGGKRTIDVKFFFEPGRPAEPALFLQYDIPPGASEGVHTHAVGHADGPWDEFYYIVSGSGQMSVGGRDVPVKAGDNVHTPLGVAHGIENTSRDELLRVFLVAISRG